MSLKWDVSTQEKLEITYIVTSNTSYCWDSSANHYVHMKYWDWRCICDPLGLWRSSEYKIPAGLWGHIEMTQVVICGRYEKWCKCTVDDSSTSCDLNLQGRQLLLKRVDLSQSTLIPCQHNTQLLLTMPSLVSCLYLIFLRLHVFNFSKHLGLWWCVVLFSTAHPDDRMTRHFNTLAVVVATLPNGKAWSLKVPAEDSASTLVTQ